MKHKMNSRKILSLAFSLAMALTMLSLTAVPVLAATGTMNIGGQTNLDMSTDQSGTGWTWTAATNTLSLTGAYGGGYIEFMSANSDLINLVCNGNVTINATGPTLYSAISCLGNLTITGSGTLTLNGGNGYAIMSGGLLTIGGILTWQGVPIQPMTRVPSLRRAVCYSSAGTRKLTAAATVTRRSQISPCPRTTSRYTPSIFPPGRSTPSLTT